MKGVIFDFNGTLYWDSQLHYDAWVEYSKILRGTPFTREEMRDKMFGHTNKDIIQYAIGKEPTAEMVEKYAKEKESLYRKRCLIDRENFKLAPGAEEFLDFLKENNIPMTIATMSEWDNVEFYIREFNLSKWFDVDKKFGTQIADEDGTWLNLYGKYNPFADTLRLECEISRDNGSEYFDYMPTESEAKLIKDMITEKINEVFGQTPKEFCQTFYETDGLYGEHSNEKPTMGGII